MKKYGLIGFPLSHSYSPGYFEDKFKTENLLDHRYDLYPLKSIEQVENLRSKKLLGFNVTIPYKQAILAYLDGFSLEVEAIGACNCVKINENGWIGYNTDAYGFEKSLLNLPDSERIKAALVLGDGGGSKAVKFVLEQHGVTFRTVSRSPKNGLNYEKIGKSEIESVDLIINTTPIGMSPEVSKAPPLPYHFLNEKHFLYDLIYNPKKTLFLTYGEQHGCTVKNGMDMLRFQADKSWEIWNNH